MFLFIPIFIIAFIYCITQAIVKLMRKKDNKQYILSAIFFFLLAILSFTQSSFSFFLFILLIVLIVMGIIIIKNNMTYKTNNRFITFFVFIFVISFLYSFTLNSNADNFDNKKDENTQKENKSKNKTKSVASLTEKDINKMSDEKMSDIIFDIDKSDELYEKNNKVYKYLFTKFFDEDYNDVYIPTQNEIENMSKNEIKELDPKTTTKLSNEDKSTYNTYLDKETKIYASETDDDDSIEELKDSIKSELTTEKIEDVTYFNDSLGSNATIIIKGEENLSDKMTSDGMRFAVAKAVKGVKNSGVALDDFTIDVTYPIEENGKTSEDQHVIKSKWSMDTVKDLSDDQLELLNTDLESFAESYNESSALK